MNRKLSSMSFVLMLVISTFAFAFMIGSETKTVSAAARWQVYDANAPNPAYDPHSYTSSLTQAPFFWSASTGFQTWSGDSPVVAPDTPNKVKASGLQAGVSIPNLQVTTALGNTPNEFTTTQQLTLRNPDTGEQDVIPKGASVTVSSSTDKDGTTYSLSYKDPETEAQKTITTPSQEAINNLKSNSVYTVVANSGLPAGTTYNPQTQILTTPSGAQYKYVTASGSTTPTLEWQGRGEVKTMFGTVGFGGAQLIQGVQWAAIAAGLVQTLGTVFGMEQAEVNAASAGIATGIMVGKASYALFGNGGARQLGINTEGTWFNSPWMSGAIGAATAWLVYNAMWSKTETSVETVTFSCLPWQAPHGGADCELCNDPSLPCSEYRCKSLGQSCAIVNKGTKAEMCVNVNARDVSPPVIKPLNSAITEGFSYFDVKEMPPGAGFKIKSSATSTGCIPPFTPMQFGIQTNEPSQCKIDVEPKGNYSKMSSYFGGNNLYSYNHTEYLSLPSAKDFQNSSIALKNGKELTFYMRCIDASGNANEADYALTLCVDPSPDTTAPVIQGTSISNGGCISAKTENATVGFYVNEPAQCRWSFTDSDYDQMANDMVCANSPVQVNALQSYICNALLTGIVRDGTKFYARCKDQPQAGVNESKRNKNMQSYMFTLRGSNELKLKTIQPNSTIYGMVNPSPVELYVETLFGCNDNKAICYYSTSDADNSFVQFYDTNNADGVSTQRLDLTTGLYTYFVKCVDAGGNLVKNSTIFNVNIDSNSPIIARTYEEDGYLKLVTAFNSDCVYTNSNCDYLFNEGTAMPYSNSTAHVTQWSEDETYYIKCRDEYRSEPADCSLIVRPTENFL